MAIRHIVTDEAILSQKSEPVKLKEDVQSIIQDLIDTAQYNSNTEVNPMGCVGLAAIQLGYAKRICVIYMDNKWVPFINPRFKPQKNTKTYLSKERCLSIDGEQETPRYLNVIVDYEYRQYLSSSGTWLSKKKNLSLNKMYSVVMQHEIDHMNGVLI